ncbi:MAG TPA: arginine repressor [Actinomycetota bacterium]|nr:arginine repressor [Actinomycetota bacterium]
MRSDRRRDLLRILHQGQAGSQQEIVDALRAAGHDVTQATVSRDLRQVGATKVKIGDEVVYRLVDDLPVGVRSDLVSRTLLSTLADFAVDIQQAASLVVVNTAPGHASAVGRAIDLAGLTEVVGTVAGDDTILVATPSAETAAELSSTWRESCFNEMEGAS